LGRYWLYGLYGGRASTGYMDYRMVGSIQVIWTIGW